MRQDLGRTTMEPDCVSRFEAHARATPERTAVLWAHHTLTYGELDARANRLAHVIAARVPGPHAAVAVCLPRTLDLPVALLATLKAGAVYVPLDPELPTERLHLLLRDTGASVLVTHAGLAERLASAAAAYRVIALDREGDALAAAPMHASVAARPANERAYVMYTSGSTGPPKGVEVEHGALSARYALSPYKTLLGPADVLAAISAVSWNPSVYEVLYTLASGAALAIASHADVRDPTRLGLLLDDHGVTFMRAVPSLWQSLVDAGWAGRPELTIVCHGERLAAPLAERLRGLGKGVSNTWGATEASVFSTVELTADGRRVIPPAAQGDADAHLLVLDADLRPVASGEAGEIHLTGRVLARGYLGDAALTARRFVALPSHPDGHPGGRIYKSGDIGRCLPDGSIELLGRDDDQVKIRGQRVELGEIEAALLRHPDVARAVVVAREDTPGDQRLVAYLIATSEVRSEVLRGFLAQALAAHMLPSAFVSLAAFPLGPNGKVDRKALPAPGRERPLLGPATAPVTALQAALARAFSEHLGYAEIGVDDDFFLLGGHSLLAAQVVAHIAVAHELEVSLATFFLAPTVRALAAHIEGRQAKGERSRRAAIVPTASHEPLPLSFAQERLWFLNRLTPDEVAYSLPIALELVGTLDEGALEAAIQLILTRHEALRTSFAQGPDGVPRQTVHATTLSLLRVAVRAEQVAEHLASAASIPFDLARAPLLRATLFAIERKRHILFVNMHHIASDGWSSALFRRELALAYNALRGGRTPALPRLPIHYRDYAQWQRMPASLARLDQQIAYWRGRLAGLEPLELPTDRPRPRVFTHLGAREVVIVPTALTSALRALAIAHGASLYMVLLATFEALLFRYSGQSDLAVGSPIAGRNAPETADLIGFFVNTLVMRAKISGDMPFAELLAQVKATTLEAWEHQDLPFERLVGELNPERDLGRHPLIQTMFALQNTPSGALALDGLDVAPLAFRNTTTRFDSELHVWERDDALMCHWIYSTDLFDPWRIQQMLRHYIALLTEVTRSPATSLARLALLSPSEHALIVETWNATARDYNLDVCVHERFEVLAKRTPDALAIATDHQSMTYASLDRHAETLARRLSARGVSNGARVALCLERSPELVASIIACMKLGAAYMPLDPSYPDERLAHMLADANAVVLVTRSSAAERFPNVTLVLCDRVDVGVEPDAVAPHTSPARPDDIAYVIYTSGSSGRPNGVEVSHRSLANLALWHCETYALSATDRATLIASPSFDASVWELWPYLIAGASLHLPAADTRVFPQRLVAWLAAHAISITFLPTPLLDACFVDAGDALAHMTHLRALLTGGDRLTRAPAAKLPFAIVNHYGPTENTVVSTAGVVAPTSPDDPIAPITIGRPIANTQAYILDAAKNPVPIGVPGELHVAGVGVARGYLDRPALTAERFSANPFGPGRLYRTGDRARYLPDGAIEFLGRCDAQIKIRGVRIEPGEIDATIAQCPGIHEAVTIAREDVPGDKRLVSYLVTEHHTGALDRAHVAQWQLLYDTEYASRRDARTLDPEHDISGWNSSFTGSPIPPNEMREWVAATIAAFSSAPHPERILEIGCGTGLLLYRLAPGAAAYVASDFSRHAIDAIGRHVARDPARFAQLQLAVATAHDLSWLDRDARFDAVILNSVVQYFPSADYLVDVLTQVIAHVAPGGRIFIGDVRNLDLLPAFQRALRHFGVAAARDDKELLLSPALFQDLGQRLPRISAVAVRPRGGRALNEMSMFRCDVTLHIDATVQHIDAAPHTFVDLAALAQQLAITGKSVFVSGLADARNSEYLDPTPLAPIDLAALYALAPTHHVDIRLGRDSRTVDALFMPLAFATGALTSDRFHVPVASKHVPVASDPLRRAREDQLLETLRAHLATRLPEALIPAAFVFLDALPLTPNDKLDRRALPAPRADRSAHLGTFVAPSTPTEMALARIFAAALGTSSISSDDNFFELGGHSLLAVQVVSRIEDRFALSLPLATLFQAPTVTRLGHHLDGLLSRQTLTATTPAAHANGAARFAESPSLAVAMLPLAPVDIAFHYARVFFAHAPHFLYQVLELHLAPVDSDRLAAALLYAVNRHPIARGRMSTRSALGNSAFWDVATYLTSAPLELHTASDHTDADRIRDAIIASPFPLDESPSFRFVLIRSPARDRLLVRYNHGAVDASGLHCMLASIMSHYLGRPDPAQRTLPFTTRELLDYYQHQTPTLANNELAHLAGLMPSRRRRLGPRTSLLRPRAIFPARIQPLGGDPEDTTCDRVECRFTRADSEQLEATARRIRSTLDRVFLVGLLAGANSHNESLTTRPDNRRIEAYWAVNLRPPRLYESIVANQFSWSRVRLPSEPNDLPAWREHMLDPAADFLLRGALDWLTIVDRFHNLDLPLPLRRLCMRAMELSAPSLVISNTLSFGTLGQGPLARDFGVASSDLHARFGFTDRPVIVIGQRDQRLHLRMVYPRSTFDQAGALHFLATCMQQTLKV